MKKGGSRRTRLKPDYLAEHLGMMHFIEWQVRATTPAVHTPWPRPGAEGFPTQSLLDPPSQPVRCYFCFHLADVVIPSQWGAVPFLGYLMQCFRAHWSNEIMHGKCRTQCQVHSKHPIKVRFVRSHQLEVVEPGFKLRLIHFQPHALFLLSGVSCCLSPPYSVKSLLI